MPFGGDGTTGYDCPDPESCENAWHTEECTVCGAWVHRGDEFTHHHDEHEAEGR